MVTKTPELGKQICRILISKGYPCQSVLVDAEFDKSSIESLLSPDGSQLILAQDRMSPYSAIEFLVDLDRQKSPRRFVVFCLEQQTYSLDQKNAFLRQGGSGFLALTPGEPREEREKKIEGMLIQAEKELAFRQDKAGSREKVFQWLGHFVDEGDFREFSLRLFRNLEFEGVHLMHGALERGKDIVFWETNKLNEREFVGVQVKMGNLKAAVVGSKHVTGVWYQALQSLNHPVFVGGREYFLDKFIVLISGTILPTADNQLRDFLRSNKYDKRIYFLGREEIADLVVDQCPALCAELVAKDN